MKKRIISAILSLAVMISAASSHFEVQEAKANNRKMNVYVNYGQSVSEVYGSSTTYLNRFPNIVNRVTVYYMAVAGINIDFKYTGSYFNVICTNADSCRSELQDFNHECLHISEYNCGNGYTYHCTNYTKIKNDEFSAADNYQNGVAFYLTSAKLCRRDSNYLHGYVNGVTFGNRKCIIARDYDYTYLYYSDPANDYVYVSGTIVHELGHMYYVTHHYENGVTDCIWGHNHNSYDVKKYIKVCSICAATIQSNADLYQHS